MSSILITGGTGSFGRAMTKRLLEEKWEADRIIIFSRGEHTQAEMAERFKRDADRLRFFIGDVRDRDRLKRAFQGVDYVIHAAALKRIEVGAYNPIEMVKTNINGAINVIEAAHDAGVKKVVALSSDKAYQPISPYGQSKALAETLFRTGYVSDSGPIFAVTRYGNIWKSQGSVVNKWQSLITQGCGRVPVTDLECTRFFMTIDHSVSFVLDTLATMQGGELKIPELPAYRLGDLVAAMGTAAEVIGLPPWEKLHEGMADGNTSDVAWRMSREELRQAL